MYVKLISGFNTYRILQDIDRVLLLKQSVQIPISKSFDMDLQTLCI